MHYATCGICLGDYITDMEIVLIICDVLVQACPSRGLMNINEQQGAAAVWLINNQFGFNQQSVHNDLILTPKLILVYTLSLTRDRGKMCSTQNASFGESGSRVRRMRCEEP